MWNCETKNVIKDGMGPAQLGPHYWIRGACSWINIHPFQIETWQTSEEYPGNSTVYRWVQEKYSFVKVFSCPAITVENEDQLLKRLETLMIFA